MSQSYETTRGQPSESATFARLLEHLRLAAQDAYTLGHLRQAAGHELSGQGFLAVGQLLERAVIQATKLATNKLH